jgi:hypothetical protein
LPFPYPRVLLDLALLSCPFPTCFFAGLGTGSNFARPPPPPAIQIKEKLRKNVKGGSHYRCVSYTAEYGGAGDPTIVKELSLYYMYLFRDIYPSAIQPLTDGKRNERFFADASQNVLLPCCYTIITIKIYLQLLKSLQVIILKDSGMTIETTTKRK